MRTIVSKTNRQKWIFILILFCISVPTVKAGNGKEQDAGLWVCAGIAPKPFAGKWKTWYSLEYRSKENFSQTSLWSLATNMDYILNPHMQIGAGYEFFLNRESDGSFSPEHRYYPEIIFSYGWQPLSLNLRMRVMNTFTKWNCPDWETRNRLKMSCEVKRTPLKPFVWVEPYHAVGSEEIRRFRKIRYAVGCSFTIEPRRHQVDVYYLREDYIQKPFVRNVIEIDYTFSIR